MFIPKESAPIEIDYRQFVTAAKLAKLALIEDALYGTDVEDSELLTPAAIITILDVAEV